MDECVFCRIINKTLPADVIYEDDEFISIRDIHPLSPVHLLVIPRRHISSINDLEPNDLSLAGKLLLTARKIALATPGTEKGYRLVINTGRGGGQSIFHLHLHILAGATIDPSLLIRGLE